MALFLWLFDLLKRPARIDPFFEAAENVSYENDSEDSDDSDEQISDEDYKGTHTLYYIIKMELEFLLFNIKEDVFCTNDNEELRALDEFIPHNQYYEDTFEDGAQYNYSIDFSNETFTISFFGKEAQLTFDTVRSMTAEEFVELFK